MYNKEKIILTKLLRIAENQQKIIIKLAQAAEGHDPMIDYINNGLIAVVAANMGLANVTADTSRHEGTPPASLGGQFVGKKPDTFISNVTGVPSDKQPAFSNAVEVQRKLQKPELDLTIFFK